MNKNRQRKSSLYNTVLKNIKAVLPYHINSHQKATFKFNADILKPLKEEVEKEQMTQETMKESLEAVSNQRSKKSKRMSLIFLLLNLLVLVGIFVFQFLREETVSISDLVTNKIHWWWVLISLGLFFMVNIIEGLKTSIIIKKATGRFRPILGFKSHVCSRFYDNITPLSTGGQPFQIYYLNKRGLNASSATSVPLAKYIYSQIVYIVLSALVLFLDGGALLVGMKLSPIIVSMCYIGLVLNLLVVLVVFALSVNKKVAPKIMLGILKLLKFLHIIKDEKAVFEKVMKITREYIVTFRMFIGSWWIILSEVVLSVASILCNYTIAFSVYCIFCDFDLSLWFTFFVIQLACDLAISFIPIPGGAGTAELSFSALCNPLYVAALGSGAGGLFVWAILFYRILTYYGYLIQGGLMILYDFLIGNKRAVPINSQYTYERHRLEDVSRLKEAVLISENVVNEDGLKKRGKTKINKNGDTVNEKEPN